jgi:hypothetical protein
MGSGLSLNAALRLGYEGGKAINFKTANTYVKELSNNLEVYVQGTKSATFESDGGVLHGSWNVESSLVTSDRRLKTNIVPLQRTLREVIAPKAEKKLTTGKSQSAQGDGALWLLRQLRPVSYSFRKGMDSKFMRFGFIADELESVVPEVVRRPGDREVTDQKAVVYQDLIALLASASQSQQSLIEQQQKRMAEMEASQLQLVERMQMIEQAKQEEASKKKKMKKRYRKKKATTTTTTVAMNMTNETNTSNSTEYQI